MTDETQAPKTTEAPVTASEKTLKAATKTGLWQAALWFLMKNSKYIAVVLVILSAGWQLDKFIKAKAQEKQDLVAKTAVIAAQRDTALQNFAVSEASAVHNKQVADNLIIQQKKSDAIIAKLLDAQQKSQKFTDNTLNKIANSKPEDDGPIAPVLHDTLEAIQNKK